MKKTLYKTNQNHPQIIAYKEAVKKGQNAHHVIFHGEQWLVKRAGSDRANHVFATQKEAADYANGIAQSQGTALFIHGIDGRIRERRDYDAGGSAFPQ
mgnify:FL=1